MNAGKAPRRSPEKKKPSASRQAITEGNHQRGQVEYTTPHRKMKGVKTMSTKEIENKIRELRETQRLIEEAQAEAEALKDEIKAYMGDSEELRAGEYKVTWKSVTSSRIDTTALKKAMPVVAEAFTRSTTTRRFCVA